jgi:hypothetical protein
MRMSLILQIVFIFFPSYLAARILNCANAVLQTDTLDKCHLSRVAICFYFDLADLLITRVTMELDG